MYFGYFAEQLSLLNMNRLAVENRHFLCLCQGFKDYYKSHSRKMKKNWGTSSNAVDKIWLELRVTDLPKVGRACLV